MNGFFLITRGISKHALFKRNPNRLAVWVWLLDNAAFKDTTQDAKGKTVLVPRGSVCASLRHIADETGVGHQVVRTALKRFESEHMVNTTVTHGKTVISLCNYEKHQRTEIPANTTPNTTVTQDQHKPNTQKKQGNKVTTEEEPKGSLSSGADLPAPIDDISQAVSAYNETASEANWPVVQKMTPARRTAIKARLSECGGLEGWRHALTLARASPFLCGDNDRGWRADFDFLTKQKSFTGLMEGKYDNRNSNQYRPGHSTLADEIADVARAR